MTDYISRETAGNAVFEAMADGRTIFTAKNVLAALNNIPAADVREEKWISVKEYMPDKCGMYYVTGGGRVWLCELFAFGETKGWINNALNPTIEAWFQIPRPPKEEQT